MSDSAPTDYQKRLSLLIRQLDELRQRGGADRIFYDLEDGGPRELTVLFEIAKQRYHKMWTDESQRTEAIRLVLADAIKNLPHHSLPGTQRDTLSWQQAALILFNVYLPPEVTAAIQNYNGHEHAKLARYIREAVAFPESDNKRADDRRFQSVVLEMRKKMAERMLKALPDDNRGGDADVSSAEDGARSDTDGVGQGTAKVDMPMPVGSSDTSDGETDSQSPDAKGATQVINVGTISGSILGNHGVQNIYNYGKQ